ncbi:MAG: tRNA uridine-5-carboxymethylaminomethyl(34) synthesis GTPase MnmE [Spirochaetes bacterium]|jgi:tRNA modification GTPase|nr:tRNA uridine-5-carboxymethylaminomethyl(34) synthesis GTPase MnmE [Spirochaetota bacterium]
MHEDTICAPATPPINSSLAVIRISGPETYRIAGIIFSRPQNLKPRHAVYGSVTENGEIIDDIIMIFYKSPQSFTGEDMTDIFCHGNPIIVRKIISLVKRVGARMAEPGEFSKRAFLNGKIDLTEAEAINHIITGRSEWEVASAIKQMHGSMKGKIDEIRDEIILLKADIEAGIDFSEEEIEFVSRQEAERRLSKIKDKLQDIFRRCRLGEKMSHGIDLPIVGRPNVGKSSILNLILNSERAIISDIPGTTRDLINEVVQFAGLRINLIDTAGIGIPSCEIEEKGIHLSRRKIETSAVIIMVVDASSGIREEDMEILKTLDNKKNVLLANKIDLVNRNAAEKIAEETGRGVIPFSARTGQGLDELENEISRIIHEEFVDYENCFVADIRVVDLLSASLENSERCAALLTQNEAPEIVAIELQSLIDTLREITGEISPDDILNSIFDRFCIGK